MQSRNQVKWRKRSEYSEILKFSCILLWVSEVFCTYLRLFTVVRSLLDYHIHQSLCCQRFYNQYYHHLYFQTHYSNFVHAGYAVIVRRFNLLLAFNKFNWHLPVIIKSSQTSILFNFLHIAVQFIFINLFYSYYLSPLYPTVILLCRWFRYFV